MNDSKEEIFDPNALAKSDKKSGDKSDKKPEAPASEKKSGAPATEDKPVDPPKAPAIAPLAIESDIPLPENNAGRKSAFNAARMPFDKLEVGQSFVETLTNGKTADGITVKTVMAQVKKALKDRTFVVRETLDDKGVPVSARFWRKK